MRGGPPPGPVPGVLVEVDEGGIRLYGVLTGWPKVAEIDVYRKVFPLLEDGGVVERHLVVVERTANGGPPPPLSQRPAEPWEWGSSVRLGDARVRLRDLAAAVHAHAPTLWCATQARSTATRSIATQPRLQIIVGQGRGAKC